MFVEPSGHITGSIGGGKVEYEVINHCKEVQEKEVKHYALTADGQDSLGMICGGQRCAYSSVSRWNGELD